MIASALRTGASLVWGHKRVIVPFYLANLFLGVAVAMPLGKLVGGFVGDSLVRERLGYAFDFDVLFEFLVKNDVAISSLLDLVLIVPVVYWLVALFFSGGALVVYANDNYKPAIFWGASAACFAPFVRLFLWSLPLLALFVSLRWLETLFVRVLWGPDPYEYVRYWGAWAKMGLTYLGLILYGIVFDYARVHLVVTGGRKARHSLWVALKFAAHHPGRTLALALILWLAGWLEVAIYYPLSTALSGAGWAVVIGLVLLQQLYIVFRLILRLTYYSSQLTLFRRLSTEHLKYAVSHLPVREPGQA
jgi:hypothetical protein